MRENKIKNMLEYILNNFLVEKQSNFKNNELGNKVRREFPIVMHEQLNLDRKHYAITGSVGKGKWATVPWISFFDREITTTATQGYYLVYLFKSDMSGFYLSLNQGYTYYKEQYGARLGREKAKAAASILRNQINVSPKFNLRSIDLASKKDLATGYENGHIIGIYYDFRSIPDDFRLIEDFHELLDAYQRIKLLINRRSVDEFNRYLLLQEDDEYLENQEIEYQQAVDKYSGIIKEDSFAHEGPRSRKELIIDESGRKKYPRDAREAAAALKEANYQCEIDPEHSTFISKSSGYPYCEAHHFIGISLYEKFPNIDLDRSQNIVCLCANCHRKIHYGTDRVRLSMIEKLYQKIRTRLDEVGIQLTLDEVKSYYGIRE